MKLSTQLIGWLTAIRLTISNADGSFSTLDNALLTDLLESFSGHDANANCPHHPTSTSTTWSTTFPGTNGLSQWADPTHEPSLFAASMSNTAGTESANAWTIRIGTGGNIYSYVTENGFGEAMPPQVSDHAPWVDEVQQTVSVNTNINNNVNQQYPQYCASNKSTFPWVAQNGTTDCAPHYVHGAGAYKDDATYTEDPFFSPLLAHSCEGNTCTFASWGQHAHVPTPFISPMIYINRYRNCEGGTLEHTQIVHNFAPANDHNHNYFNVGWGGVRPSNLPYALEASSLTESLNYDNVDTIKYLDINRWGSKDDSGSAQGIEPLGNTGGYTTFVGEGLLINKPDPVLTTFCRKPDPDGNCITNPSTCMQASCTDDQVATGGYVRVPLGVLAGTGPACQVHANVQTPGCDNCVALQCELRPETGFGRTNPSLSGTDPSAPWKKTRIGFFNTVTKQMLEVAFVRHWSWGATDKKVYFSVFTEDEAKAISMVNAMFDNANGSEDLPIELRTIHLQEREKYGMPWCREQTCTSATKNVCMQPCTDLESTKNNWPRLQLGVRPAITQNCRRHGSIGTGHKGYLRLQCQLLPNTGWGETHPYSHNGGAYDISLHNTKTGKSMEVSKMNHWSWNKNNHWVYFSTYIADDNAYNGSRIDYAKQLANEVFASDPNDVVPIEVHRVTVPNIQPYCKNSTDGSMAECTDQEIEASGGTLSRMELSVPVGGPNCKRHSTWRGYVVLKCDMHPAGYASNSPWERTPIGFRNTATDKILEVSLVRHWSWGTTSQKTFFGTFIQDTGDGRSEAIAMVNNLFANTGTDRIPIEVIPIDPGFTTNNSHGLSTRIRDDSAAISVPPGYDAASLPSFTYVYGDGSYYSSSSIPGSTRRRIGSSERDYNVFTVNWHGGASLKGGETYHNRGFIHTGNLGSVETTATGLRDDDVYIDKISENDWNQRDVDIYHQSSSSSFVVLAASAVGGTTTCLTGITKVCSGSSTPKTGKKPFFYVTCGATTYVGSDPYALSPYDNFPNHGNTTNIVRSYVCKGQQSTRPTWKLLGFFNPDECTSAELPDTATYAEGICN